jgi:hypothetical protein
VRIGSNQEVGTVGETGSQVETIVVGEGVLLRVVLSPELSGVNGQRSRDG